MLADAGSTPAASTKNGKGSSTGWPFFVCTVVTVELATATRGQSEQSGGAEAAKRFDQPVIERSSPRHTKWSLPSSSEQLRFLPAEFSGRLL